MNSAKVEIWLGVTDASHHSLTTEYSATQLVSSIKFKLSHAIETDPQQEKVTPTPTSTPRTPLIVQKS